MAGMHGNIKSGSCKYIFVEKNHEFLVSVDMNLGSLILDTDDIIEMYLRSDDFNAVIEGPFKPTIMLVF